MKPWEETWRWEEGSRAIHLCDDPYTMGLFSKRESPLETNRARARRAAAAPDLARALLAVEWVREGDGGDFWCPYCEALEKNGHTGTCILASAIRKAGVR